MNHNRFDNIISWIYPILFISFFLPMKLQTWTLIACSILIVLLFILSKAKISLNEFIIATLLGAGYFFYVAYIPLTPPFFKQELFRILEQKASFVLLPFIMLCLTKISSLDPKKHIILFPIGTALLSILTNGYILFHSTKEIWTNHVNYRTTFESLSGIHPSYFGIYVCIGIAICWLQDKNSLSTKLMHWLLQAILLISLILLTPKSALIALVIIFLIRTFVFERKMIRTGFLKTISILLALCLVYLIIPFFHQRVNEVIGFATGHQHDVINNSMDMRNLLFSIDIGLLKQHWLLGIGPIQLQQELNLLLQLSGSLTGQAVQQYNTHNEYLNQWLCFGLGGFIYFVSLMGIHVRRSIITQNQLYFFLMVILLISFLTENVLSRQHGILFYSLFSSLFFFSSRKS